MSKIKEYSQKTAVTDTDVMVVEDSATKYAELSTVKTYVLGGTAERINTSVEETSATDSSIVPTVDTSTNTLKKFKLSTIKDYVLGYLGSKINAAAEATTTEDTDILAGTDGSTTTLKKFTLLNLKDYVMSYLPTWTGRDSGWQTIIGSSYDSGNLTTPTAGTAIAYRRVGNMVYVCGEVGVTNKVANTSLLLFTLPSGYRTDYNFYHFNTATGTRCCRVYIKSDGTFNLEWVRNVTDGTEMTDTINWISIETCYPYV